MKPEKKDQHVFTARFPIPLRDAIRKKAKQESRSFHAQVLHDLKKIHKIK